MLRWQREMPRPGNLKQLQQLLTMLACLNSPRLLFALKIQFHGMTRIHTLLSMKIMTMTTTNKTLTGTLVTVMMSWMTLHTLLVHRQMTQNFLNSWMAIWKTLMRPHLKCMHRQVAVFKKHVSFWLVTRVPEAIFLWLVLVLFDGSAQPSTDLKPAKYCGKGKKGKRKGKSFLRKVENRQAWVHLAFCPNHRTHVSSLVLRCPSSVQLRLTQLVVDHITLLVFVLISAFCVDMWDIVLQNVPTKGKRLPSHLENVHLVPMLWVVQCSIPRVMVQLSRKSNEIKTRMTLKTLLLSQSRFAILDGRATKTVSGFMSVQPVADQYEGTTIETTDVGFTFAGGETEAASTKICIPHAEFPQGISVNDVERVNTVSHRHGCAT